MIPSSATVPNGTTAVEPTGKILPDPSSIRTIDSRKSSTTIAMRKNKKKKQISVSDAASSASSSNYCCSTSSSQKGIRIFKNPRRIRVGSMATPTRRSASASEVDALGLPLGMSIAAVVAQVLEKKGAAGEMMPVEDLCGICTLAVRESLGNGFGGNLDHFVTNFEKSFRSTLMTLRLINNLSQSFGGQIRRDGFREGSCSSASTGLSLDRLKDSQCCSGATYGLESLPSRTRPERQCYTCEKMEENMKMSLMNQQFVLQDNQIQRQLICDSGSRSLSNSSISQSSFIRAIEKSTVEQTRSNDLKAFKIGLKMKDLQLKEKQLALNSDANLLERLKLSMGFSKASFKVEKFKTQVQDARQVELLKKCLDFLVAGLLIMLLSLAYGTYIYSHRRIIEATEACSPYKESKSWWMPKSMATFNSGLQLLKCQIQVLSRMLFGALMIGAIAFLLIQRSAASHQTMPVTIILLLLGGACGYAGKLCIYTLGGNGNHWLIYWEALCLLHFFSNTFHSTLFLILNGNVNVAERVEKNPILPYWMRRVLFFATLLFLPLLCGLMPFASPREWLDHFSPYFLGDIED